MFCLGNIAKYPAIKDGAQVQERDALTFKSGVELKKAI